MLRSLVAFGLLLGLSVGVGHAQQLETPEGSGTVEGQAALTDWPESLPRLLDEMGTDAPYLLPEIDSLGVEYRYATSGSTSQWSFVLAWTPGRRVLYQGNVLPRGDGPSGVRMVNVELRAEVVSEGETVGEMIVAVDSMSLRPLPSLYSFEVEVSHDRVFLDTPADEARRALERGITLRNPIVERMGFASPDARPSSGQRTEPDGRPRRPDAGPPPSVYEPRVAVRIGWRIGPRPFFVAGRDGDGREVRPRGESTGRSPEARRPSGAAGDDEADEDDEEGEERTGRTPSGETTGDEADGESSGDEEDDDEPDLRTPALVAAGAVALAATVGGTVGAYGTGTTPVGLTAGYTRPSGGLHLQAAINTAVLEDDADQELTVKALGFYDAFGSRVQPALGLGVRANDDVDPSVSVGLVGRVGRFVLQGGVDVVHGRVEAGLSYNFRHGGDSSGE